MSGYQYRNEISASNVNGDATGTIILYSKPATLNPFPVATVGSVTISGTTGTALTPQTAIITLIAETVTSAGLSAVNAASW